MGKKRKKIDTSNYTNWKIVTTCELNAPADVVWKLVGGFYNISEWCPDISISEVQRKQNKDRDIRRKIIFTGQPPAWEELVFMDNENMRYKYKWYKGEWGELVQNYHAEIEVIETKVGKKCLMKWSSTFYYDQDAITQFYHNGFDYLIKLYGGKY